MEPRRRRPQEAARARWRSAGGGCAAQSFCRACMPSWLALEKARGADQSNTIWLLVSRAKPNARLAHTQELRAVAESKSFCLAGGLGWRSGQLDMVRRRPGLGNASPPEALEALAEAIAVDRPRSPRAWRKLAYCCSAIDGAAVRSGGQRRPQPPAIGDALLRRRSRRSDRPASDTGTAGSPALRIVAALPSQNPRLGLGEPAWRPGSRRGCGSPGRGSAARSGFYVNAQTDPGRPASFFWPCWASFAGD